MQNDFEKFKLAVGCSLALWVLFALICLGAAGAHALMEVL